MALRSALQHQSEHRSLLHELQQRYPWLYFLHQSPIELDSSVVRQSFSFGRDLLWFDENLNCLVQAELHQHKHSDRFQLQFLQDCICSVNRQNLWEVGQVYRDGLRFFSFRIVLCSICSIHNGQSSRSHLLFSFHNHHLHFVAFQPQFLIHRKYRFRQNILYIFWLFLFAREIYR